MNRLIITCPDCQLEKSVRQLFEGENHLLTSLGAISPLADPALTDEIALILSEHSIQEIVLLLSSNCSYHGFDHYSENRGYHKAFAGLIIENSLQKHLRQLNKIPEVARLLDRCYLVTRGFVLDKEKGQLREFHEFSTHCFLN